MTENDRFEKGLANRVRIFGAAHEEERRKRRDAACPDFSRFITEEIFGRLYERRGIDPVTREMLILAVLCARGCHLEFEHHVAAGIRQGMKKEDVHEVLMVCAYYAGAPRAVGAAAAALRAFEAMGA